MDLISDLKTSSKKRSKLKTSWDKYPYIKKILKMRKLYSLLRLMFQKEPVGLYTGGFIYGGGLYLEVHPE